MAGPYDIDELRASLAGLDLPGWTPPTEGPPPPASFDEDIRRRIEQADLRQNEMVPPAQGPTPLGAAQPGPEQPAPQATPAPFAPLGQFAQGFTSPEAQERTAQAVGEQEAAEGPRALPNPEAMTAADRSQARAQLENEQIQALNQQGQDEAAAQRAEAANQRQAAIERQRLNERNAIQTERDLNERNAVLHDKQADLFRQREIIRNTKIDPDRMFEGGAGTARKIAAIISVTIGGLLFASTGKNPGAEIIDKAIGRDIDAQEKNLDNLKDVYAEDQSLLAMTRQMYTDRDAARMAAHAHALEGVAAAYDERAASIKDMRAQETAAKGAFAARERAAKMFATADQRELEAADRDWEKKKFRLNLGQGYAQLGEQIRHNKKLEGLSELELSVRDKESERRAKAEGDKNKADQVKGRIFGVKNVVTGPDGQPTEVDYVDIPDAERKKKLDEIVSSGRKNHRSFETILKLGADRNAIRDQDKALVQAEWAKIQLNAQAFVKGIPSDFDAKKIERAVGMKDPSAGLDLLSKKEREYIIRYMQDSNALDVDEEFQQSAGKGVHWVPPKGDLVTEPEAQRERHPFEIRDTLDTKSRVSRDAPTGAHGSFRGRSTEYGQSLLEIAKSGAKDPNRAREALNVLRKEAVPYLANAPMTETDNTIRAEIQAALAEAQRNVDRFEGQKQMKDRIRHFAPGWIQDELQD